MLAHDALGCVTWPMAQIRPAPVRSAAPSLAMSPKRAEAKAKATPKAIAKQAAKEGDGLAKFFRVPVVRSSAAPAAEAPLALAQSRAGKKQASTAAGAAQPRAAKRGRCDETPAANVGQVDAAGEGAAIEHRDLEAPEADSEQADLRENPGASAEQATVVQSELRETFGADAVPAAVVQSELRETFGADAVQAAVVRSELRETLGADAVQAAAARSELQGPSGADAEHEAERSELPASAGFEEFAAVEQTSLRGAPAEDVETLVVSDEEMEAVLCDLNADLAFNALPDVGGTAKDLDDSGAGASQPRPDQTQPDPTRPSPTSVDITLFLAVVVTLV